MAPIARLVSARMFSTAARLRSSGAYTRAAPADWNRVFRRELRTFSVYAPLMGFFLGWPVALETMLDGHIQ
ncbi:hypothetical protein B7463_g8884, partial [Scytalidium lignicola]